MFAIFSLVLILNIGISTKSLINAFSSRDVSNKYASSKLVSKENWQSRLNKVTDYADFIDEMTQDESDEDLHQDINNWSEQGTGR